MPRFIIKREIPDAGKMSDQDLAGASAHSCSVLREMDGISWVQSYVTENQIYCIYDASSEAQIREHAEKSGFPANAITEVSRVIDPTWANATA